MTAGFHNTTIVSRPDWLLYVVPSIAFVLGVILFSLVHKTQRRREKTIQRVAALKTVINSTQNTHTYSQDHRGRENEDSGHPQNSNETQRKLTKQEAQSYENVTTIIYNNEDKVHFCFRQDDDYVTPDAADEDTETDTTTYIQPTQNLTDTDGESYENMEGCVYAHPRQHTKSSLSIEDDDYIIPDGDGQHNLEQTDTESYENMAGSACPDQEVHTNAQTVSEGWYECMDRKQRGNSRT